MLGSQGINPPSPPFALKEPENVSPRYQQIDKYFEYLAAIEKCSDIPDGLSGELAVKKLIAEYKLSCKNEKKIPEFLWKEEPLIHPLGGSWAARLHTRYGMVLDSEKKKYLHIADPIAESFWTPEAIEAILAEDAVFFLRDKVYLYISSVGINSQYLVLDREQYEKLTYSWDFRFVSSIDTKCVSVEKTGCWVPAIGFLKLYRARLFVLSTLVFILGLILLVFFNIRRKKQAEEALLVAAMAISHELRHPVSVLSLLLDRMRGRYDEIPETLQGDYFKIANEVHRLRLLMQASEAFLKRSPDQAYSWDLKTLDSPKAWAKKLSESYDIEFIWVGDDRPFMTDPYWLGVAIENLIKNAIRYGLLPISLKIIREKSKFEVQVSDKGQLKKQKIKSYDEALGMGHIMINKISRAMGGRGLRVQENPTVYSFFVKELVDEDNFTGRR